MSLLKQSDVKNHLSPRYRSKIHLRESVCQPDATSASVAEPDVTQAIPSDFARDFVAEHSSAGTVERAPLTGSFSSQAPAASRSVQP